MRTLLVTTAVLTLACSPVAFGWSEQANGSLDQTWTSAGIGGPGTTFSAGSVSNQFQLHDTTGGPSGTVASQSGYPVIDWSSSPGTGAIVSTVNGSTFDISSTKLVIGGAVLNGVNNGDNDGESSNRGLLFKSNTNDRAFLITLDFNTPSLDIVPVRYNTGTGYFSFNDGSDPASDPWNSWNAAGYGGGHAGLFDTDTERDFYVQATFDGTSTSVKVWQYDEGTGTLGALLTSGTRDDSGPGQYFTTGVAGIFAGHNPNAPTQAPVHGEFDRLGATNLTGDSDFDGDVDLNDLGNLATSYGALSGKAWSQGDFDGDGDVDLSDLGQLATFYGSGAAQAFADFQALTGQSVPEPTSLATLSLAAALMWTRRRPGASQR